MFNTSKGGVIVVVNESFCCYYIVSEACLGLGSLKEFSIKSVTIYIVICAFDAK